MEKKDEDNLLKIFTKNRYKELEEAKYEKPVEEAAEVIRKADEANLIQVEVDTENGLQVVQAFEIEDMEDMVQAFAKQSNQEHERFQSNQGKTVTDVKKYSELLEEEEDEDVNESVERTAEAMAEVVEEASKWAADQVKLPTPVGDIEPVAEFTLDTENYPQGIKWYTQDAAGESEHPANNMKEGDKLVLMRDHKEAISWQDAESFHEGLERGREQATMELADRVNEQENEPSAEKQEDGQGEIPTAAILDITNLPRIEDGEPKGMYETSSVVIPEIERVEDEDELVRPEDVLQRIDELEQEEIKAHGYKPKVQEHAYNRLKRELRQKMEGQQ